MTQVGEIFTEEEVDEILGIPPNLNPGARIAWAWDKSNLPGWHNGFSFQQLAFQYAGTEKDNRE